MYWGSGQGNLNELFTLMADQKLKPTLIGLEYSYDWGNSLPDIKKSKDFFDNSVIQIIVNKP